MKDRTWTKLLEAAGSRSVNHPRFEVTLTRRKLIAEMVLTALTDGVIVFMDEREVQIGSKEWLEMVRWVYTHIDGPAPTHVQMSTPEGEALRIEDVNPLSPAERLAKLNALYEQVRVKAAGQTSINGQAPTNGVHGAGLADT